MNKIPDKWLLLGAILSEILLARAKVVCHLAAYACGIHHYNCQFNYVECTFGTVLASLTFEIVVYLIAITNNHYWRFIDLKSLCVRLGV